MDWLSPIKELFDIALPVLDRVPVIRATIVFIVMFLLPGFAWTLIFFKKMSFIERIPFSFGISLAIVTLSIIAANLLFGMRINGLNSLMVILFITVLPFIIRHFINRLSKRKDTPA